MTADFAEASHGPAIDWRESSFLDNPRAWQVKYSKLTVHTCGASDKAGCADGTTPARVVKHAVKLRMGLNDKEIALALMTIARDYKLIHFEDPVGLWGGFAEEEATRKFKRRMDQYGSLWCCVNAHPGHVWYDFFWDQMPHVDRHDRKIEGKWHPKTGP